METLGQYLRREREFRGMSLEKLSGLTRINPSVLKRIEEDNLTAAPQSIYLKSFLKTYASHLGLDLGDVMGRYESQKGDEPAATPMPIAADASPSFPPWAWALSGLVAATLIVFAILRFKHAGV